MRRAKASQFDVAIVGEFNIDLVLYGLPDDLPPERELLANHIAFQLGGSPAITANNLARLGNRVGLISAKANDMLADYCVAELKNAGVDLSRLVAAPSALTTGVTVLLQHGAFRRCLTYPGSTAYLTLDHLDLDYLRQAKHFHLGSFYLQKGLQQDIPRLLALLKESGLTTSMDTNDDPAGTWEGPIAETLRFVDLFMPNASEAMALTGLDSLEPAIALLARQVPVVVVKRGALGALVVDHGQRLDQPAARVQAVDAVGAGDSFNAGFLYGFVRDWTMDKCLTMGNLAGAYSTTQAGGVAAFKDPIAMRAFFDSHAPSLWK